MRILQVVRDMHPREGGPPRVVAGASAALAELGHTVTIAASVRPGEEAAVRTAWPELAASGVALQLFRASQPLALGGSADLTAYMRNTMPQFDVAHLHGVWDGCQIATARAARRSGRPYFVSPHGMLDRWSMARSYWKKWAVLHLAGGRPFLDHAARFVFGTDEEADEAAALRFQAPTCIVANGVAPTLIAQPDPAAKARLHAALPQTAHWSRTVLFYSRLHPKKGVDLLIAAFAEVAAVFPDTGLLVAGIPQDSAYTAGLHAQIVATGLSERIILTTDFAGPDSRFLLDAADIFALPSHQEGFSMAIIEAMGRSLPVLITDRCHLPEVATLAAGRVVTPTVAGLAEGLRDLLSRTPAALSAAGAAGQTLVAARYTWPQVAQRLVEHYTHAVSKA